MSDSRIEPSALLNHTGWLEGLVRRLVSGAEVDEVVQETIRRALTGGLRRESAARSFLATVARNVARRNAARDESRRERESRVAVRDLEASTVDVVGRIERQRMIADAVLGLDEPYRRTILLRFFEDRSPTEISRLDDVPIDTVKSRIRRGLERLREALRAEAGDEPTWVLAMLPLIDQSGGPEGAPPSGAIPGAVIAVGIVLVSIAAIYLLLQLIGWALY